MANQYIENDKATGEKPNAETNILIGYGGFAKIHNNFNGDISDIHVSSASMQLQYNRPTTSFMWSPRDNKQISEVITSVGTAIMNVNISFDFSKKLLKTLFTEDFLCRNRSCDVCISDGNNVYMASQCYWNSFSITANPHALVTGSISFVSMNRKLAKIGRNSNTDSEGGYSRNCVLTKFKDDENNDITIQDSLGSTNFRNIENTPNILKNQLVAYWQAGFNMVQSFTINIQQQTTPVYLNNPYMMPSYIRCGGLGITAQISSWYDWVDLLDDNKDLKIKIAEKSIKIHNKVTQSMQFTHNGAQDIGSHTYTIMGSIDEINDDGVKLFTIN